MQARLRFVAALALSVLLAALTGCQTAKEPSSSGLASLVVRGSSPAQIRDATRDVFWENGYRVRQASLTHLTLEKEGSKMSNVAYGGWLGDTPVWIRVKLSILPFGEGGYRLDCLAFYVRDLGGPTEEESRMSRLKKGPYQKLLDEVGRRLSRPVTH